MKQKVAVEPHLTQVRELLSSKGFQVENINTGEVDNTTSNNYAAIVVNGISPNFLGIQDTATKAIVINADGLTADEIYNEIQSRLK